MKLITVGLEDQHAWEKTLVDYEHSFFHTYDCIKAVQKTHPMETELYEFIGGSGSVIVPLQKRFCNEQSDFLTPYGYSGVLFKNYSAQLFNELKEKLRELGIVCSYITNHPVFTDSFSLNEQDFYLNNTSFVNDLSLSREELFKNLVGRKRSQVKLKGEAKLVCSKEKLLEHFVDLYYGLMKKLEVNSYYLFSRETLEDLISSENSFLIGIELEDKIVACTLFGQTPHICDFLLNGATDEGRRYSSVLLWEGMMHAKNMGIPHFNFGGGMSQGDSLAKFKSLFGGKELPFGAFKVIHDLKSYQDLCRSQGIDYKEDLTGFFPAYHQKK